MGGYCQVAARVLGAVLLLSSCTTVVRGDGVRAACRPAFLGVPGSGQGINNPPPDTVPIGVSQEDARNFGTTIAVLKTALDEIAGDSLGAAEAIDYPAVPVQQYVSRHGLAAGLETSELAGVQAVLAAIRRAQASPCEDRPILLAGYSQGAEVVVRSVGALSKAEEPYVTVALVANPSFQPGRAGNYPETATFDGVRPALRDGEVFELPAAVRLRVIDVCATGDPVCGVDPSVGGGKIGKAHWVVENASVHTETYAFGSADLMRTAAEFLWEKRTK